MHFNLLKFSLNLFTILLLNELFLKFGYSFFKLIDSYLRKYIKTLTRNELLSLKIQRTIIIDVCKSSFQNRCKYLFEYESKVPFMNKK